MMTLVSYDVSTVDAAGRKRLRKVAKECVNYGQRVQNSVFEGEISKVQILNLRKELEPHIDKELDSIILFKSRQEKWLDKELWGMQEDKTDFVL